MAAWSAMRGALYTALISAEREQRAAEILADGTRHIWQKFSLVDGLEVNRKKDSNRKQPVASVQ